MNKVHVDRMRRDFCARTRPRVSRLLDLVVGAFGEDADGVAG